MLTVSVATGRIWFFAHTHVKTAPAKRQKLNRNTMNNGRPEPPDAPALILPARMGEGAKRRVHHLAVGHGACHQAGQRPEPLGRARWQAPPALDGFARPDPGGAPPS